MTPRRWKNTDAGKSETQTKTHSVRKKLSRQDVVLFLVLVQVLLLIVILIRLAQTTSKGVDRQETTTTIATTDLRVQVLNGTGIQQPLAGKVTDWLKRNGYSMIEAGNADNMYNNNHIYYYSPNRKEEAVRLAGLLGVNIQYVVLGSSSDNSDGLIRNKLTVVVGRDYEQLTPFLNDR